MMHLTCIKEVVMIPTSRTTRFWTIFQRGERGNSYRFSWLSAVGCGLRNLRLAEIASCSCLLPADGYALVSCPVPDGDRGRVAGSDF